MIQQFHLYVSERKENGSPHKMMPVNVHSSIFRIGKNEKQSKYLSAGTQMCKTW